VKIDGEVLSEQLSIPLVPTTAVRGLGIQTLTASLKTVCAPQFHLSYPAEIENAITQVCSSLPKAPIAARSVALLWLSGDAVAGNWIQSHVDEHTFQTLCSQRDDLQRSLAEPLPALIQRARLLLVEQMSTQALVASGRDWQGRSARLGHLTTHPLWGIPILALVLYSLYWFVGVFGAGTLVNGLEKGLFAQVINPWVTSSVNRWVPVPLFAELLVGKYGIWTMGMTYALALILPIVSTFFLAFGILEDSGYLPRLAVLSNRLFTKLGLNGKAVLPMVLGLGCVTMATLTTRVLENKRERLLVTLLLALAIPCSAQLGVVMGMLAGISFTATLIWGGIVFMVLLAVGWLAARLVPGERTPLMVELPPLRLPIFSNVILKTLARLEWYIKEVLPLFLFGAVLMFVLDKTSILGWLTRAAEPLVTGWLGLPPETSAAFLMGFLRRDFGATGLFVIQSQGLLSPLQVVVSMVTVTLFIPCIASVMMISKERGWRSATGILVVVFPLAFLIGGLLNRLLITIGWGV
jgi:ferrous iron transport protein B